MTPQLIFRLTQSPDQINTLITDPSTFASNFGISLREAHAACQLLNKVNINKFLSAHGTAQVSESSQNAWVTPDYNRFDVAQLA